MAEYPEEWLEEDRKYLLDAELDDEGRYWLELSKEDLMAMWDAATPAKIARREPLRIRRRRKKREREAARQAAGSKPSV